MKFVDPDGREVRVAGTQEYQDKVNADISRGKLLDRGFAQRMQQLETSKHIHTILNAKSDPLGPFNKNISVLEVGQTESQVEANESNGIGTSTETLYDPDNHSIQTGETRPPIMGLAHEISHAAEKDAGTLNQSTTEDNAVNAAAEMRDALEKEAKQE